MLKTSPDDQRFPLWVDEAIPLAWVGTNEVVPYANLGDALSAVVVSTIAGRAVAHADFDSPAERLAGIGTIAQEQRNGIVHLWGTGLDGTVNIGNPALGRYEVPEGTTIVAHAVRGPGSAHALRRAGVDCPSVYGDPAWFLPKIFPASEFAAEPRYELGVICHISELEAHNPEAGAAPRFLRYAIDEGRAHQVKLINTFCEPTLDSMRAKVAEILSCRRILSSSFHGLVIPLTYGIPALYFGFGNAGFDVIDAADTDRVDHRFSDFFRGIGMNQLPCILSERKEPSDWDALMRIVDRESFKLNFSGRDLFAAFPGPKAVSLDAAKWPVPEALSANFRF